MTHYTDFRFKMSIFDWDSERNWSQRAYFSRKLFDWNHIWPWPAYTRDTSIYRISIQNVLYDGDYERKPIIIGFYLSQRRTTLLKIIRPEPNSNSTWLFSWHIYIPNVISKSLKVIFNLNSVFVIKLFPSHVETWFISVHGEFAVLLTTSCYEFLIMIFYCINMLDMTYACCWVDMCRVGSSWILGKWCHNALIWDWVKQDVFFVLER